MKDEVVVIVGSGQAAGRAAFAMRSAGYGGFIRMFGAERHLPYERPALSKALLQDPDAPVPFVAAADAYAEAGIEVATGSEVASIDRAAKSVRLASGEYVRYDRLLLATGSRLRPLAIAGYPADQTLYLRSLDDCRDIERRIANSVTVAVVGGGFIGLEVAATLASRGCRVTVVELADRLLPRLGCVEASQMVLDHHRKSGIDIRLGAQVTGGGPAHLDLGDGSRIDADFVVAGVGVMPETSLAEAAGLEVSDGIVVDEFCRTSDPDIFAAGDVTRQFNPLLGRQIRLESWQNANVQGDAAGRGMAGVPTACAEMPWLWSDQGSLNLQMAGVPDRADQVIVRGDLAGDEGISVFQFLEGRLVGGLTLNRGKEMPLIRRMLAIGSLALAPDMLADAGIPLRQFLPARTAA